MVSSAPAELNSDFLEHSQPGTDGEAENNDPDLSSSPITEQQVTQPDVFQTQSATPVPIDTQLNAPRPLESPTAERTSTSTRSAALNQPTAWVTAETVGYTNIAFSEGTLPPCTFAASTYRLVEVTYPPHIAVIRPGVLYLAGVIVGGARQGQSTPRGRTKILFDLGLPTPVFTVFHHAFKSICGRRVTFDADVALWITQKATRSKVRPQNRLIPVLRTEYSPILSFEEVDFVSWA